MRSIVLTEIQLTQKFSVAEFLNLLSVARNEGRARVDIDLNKAAHPSSPLPFESFKGAIAYVYIGVVFAVLIVSRVFLSVSWANAGIALAGISLVYWIVGRRLLEARARRKIADHLLSDSDAWEKMWRYGGVTLTIVDPAAPQTPLVWISPKDDWREALAKL